MIKKLLLAVAFVAMVINLTACPSRSEIKNAYKASAGIAKACGDAAITIDTLFTGKIITYDQKERLIAKLKIVRDNGERFQASIDAVWLKYGANAPTDEINTLDVLFDRDVIGPLMDLLTEAGVLSQAASQKVLAGLAVLKLAVLAVAEIFGKFNVNSQSMQFYLRENYNV